MRFFLVSYCVIFYDLLWQLVTAFHFFIGESDSDDSEMEEVNLSDEGAESDSDDDQRAESDREDDLPEQAMSATEEFVYWAKRHWEHYRPLLLGDYVRVAALCAVNPVLINFFKDPANADPDNFAAVKRVCTKVCMPDFKPGCEDDERAQAKLVDVFYDELKCFQDRTGYYAERCE